MKQLIITLTDDNELKVQASHPLNPQELTDLTLSTILAMFNQATSDAPEPQKQEVKEYLFNMFNYAASALLAQFAPDIELRPDITEEAILRHELEIANDKLKSTDSN